MQFCTISTISHLHKAYALAESIHPFEGKLHVLISDKESKVDIESKHDNIQLHSLNDIKAANTKKIIKKYKGDKLRWSLKPGFLLYLFDSLNVKKVIYIDNDICFFNNPKFLFEKLEKQSLLLSPHFYPSDPEKKQNWLEANLRLGLFNAGFIAANKGAIEALRWWEKCCLYKMKRAYYRGLFDDQKYLDLIPVLFEKVEILKHRGCNLAGWNSEIKMKNEEILFIHFNPYTLNQFSSPSHMYHSFFKQYVEMVKKYKLNYAPPRNKASLFKVESYIIYLIWKAEQLLH